jgi:hypothetical protein
MRYIFALLASALFAGCATGKEDAAFFNTGWLKPEEGANERMYQDKKGIPDETPRR